MNPKQMEEQESAVEKEIVSDIMHVHDEDIDQRTCS